MSTCLGHCCFPQNGCPTTTIVSLLSWGNFAPHPAHTENKLLLSAVLWHTDTLLCPPSYACPVLQSSPGCSTSWKFQQTTPWQQRAGRQTQAAMGGEVSPSGSPSQTEKKNQHKLRKNMYLQALSAYRLWYVSAAKGGHGPGPLQIGP